MKSVCFCKKFWPETILENWLTIYQVKIWTFNIQPRKRIKNLKICESSHKTCSMKKGVPRNFAKFTRKQQCQSSFLIKLHAEKFLRTPFSQNNSGRLFLTNVKDSHIQVFQFYDKGSMDKSTLRLKKRRP